MTEGHSVSQLLSDAQDMQDAAARCDSMWLQLRRTASGTSLTYLDAVNLVQKHAESLQKLLLVSNADEMMELMDADQNGHLDEDEQLLLFSLVKERMQRVATELRLCHEYGPAETLMKEARKLEQRIFSYQHELRSRIYSLEGKIQNAAIDQDRKRFNTIWSHKLAEVKREAAAKIAELKASHTLELEQLEAEYSSMDRLSIKPRESYLELQTEERMAAITEKYSEAKKARSILLEAGASESQRVQFELQKSYLSKVKNTINRHKLELECAQQRADTALELVKRRMETARLQLNKAIANRVKTLEKVQADGYREGNKMGLLREELRRIKDQSKKIVVALNDLKYSPLSLIKGDMQNRSSASLPPVTTSRKEESTLSSAKLKALIPEVPKFRLKNEVLRIEAPNISNVGVAGHKKRAMHYSNQAPLPLAALYDSDLSLLSPQSDLA